eukprot:332590-Rhodomonas_salina.2
MGSEHAMFSTYVCAVTEVLPVTSLNARQEQALRTRSQRQLRSLKAGAGPAQAHVQAAGSAHGVHNVPHNVPYHVPHHAPAAYASYSTEHSDIAGNHPSVGGGAAGAGAGAGGGG